MPNRSLPESQAATNQQNEPSAAVSDAIPDYAWSAYRVSGNAGREVTRSVSFEVAHSQEFSFVIVIKKDGIHDFE